MSQDCGCPPSRSRLSKPTCLVHKLAFYITRNYTRWSNNNYEEIRFLPTNLKDRILHTVLHSGAFGNKKQGSELLKFCTALMHCHVKCFDFHELYAQTYHLISVEDAKRILTDKPHLKKLILARCIFVTDELLLHIVDNCPNLQILDLSYCLSLSEKGVSVLSKLKHLTVLSVTHTGTSDEGLLPVLSSPTGGNFKELRLEYSKVVQSLMKIPEYCPHLEVLTCNELPYGLDCDFSQMKSLKQLTWIYYPFNIRQI